MARAWLRWRAAPQAGDFRHMPRTPAPARHGYTLAELAVVLTIVGLISFAGIRALAQRLDRLAVRAAVAEAAGAVSRARDVAAARGAIVRVVIDAGAGTVTLRAGDDQIARHALGHAHGVTLSASRDSVAFDGRGLGYGAANFTLVARRGSAADTLVVSRLGRIRY